MSSSLICFGIGVMICNPLNPAPHQPATVNSYCALYQRILRSEQEAEQVGRIESRAVRERIAYNEAFFRCSCEGWDHAICRSEAFQAREAAAHQP